MRTQSHQRAGRFHEAGFYRDDAEFRSLIVPFAEEGVAAGQPVILGYDDRKADLLRSWLSDPAAVTFIADDSLSGSATQMLPNGNGPVWSYDNLHETITAKPESGPGNWNVTIRVGSDSNYHGFADPRMASEGSSDPGGILASQGTVTGSIRYDIQSDTRRTRPTSRPPSRPAPGSARCWASCSTATTPPWVAATTCSTTPTWAARPTHRPADQPERFRLTASTAEPASRSMPHRAQGRAMIRHR